VTYDIDAAAKRYLDIWIHLLDLKRWSVVFSVVDDPIESNNQLTADNTYQISRGVGASHIRLYRPHLRSNRDVEEAVIHELLHLYDHGLGLPPALHRFIARLERPLRLARKRASTQRVK